MLMGMVSRTDNTIISTFMALWITATARAQGLSTLEAVKIAGTVTGIMAAAQLLGPPLVGILMDRLNRVAGWPLYAFALALGITEAAQGLCQQTLFGQEAPAHLRATAYGMFAWLSTCTVIFASIGGGLLFDRLGPASPFVMMGTISIGCVSVGAWALSRGRPP